MRSFIASVLLLFSSFSFAMSDSDVFVATDVSGLKIFLVSNSCPIIGAENARIAIMSYENKMIVGCWFLANREVNILWVPDNHEPFKTTHDINIFALEKMI